MDWFGYRFYSIRVISIVGELFVVVVRLIVGLFYSVDTAVF